jgi:hypothetical protein
MGTLIITGYNYLLLEGGTDYLLLETGDKIIISVNAS